MTHQSSPALAELTRYESAFAVAKPELEMTVRDPELDIEGYVVVWNSKPGLRGPLGPMGKGGTRITPSVTLGEVAMLSQRMAMKNAAAGLPMGGAKSGLRADPDAPGFEAQYRRFAQLVAPMLRERGGIFGGFGFDIGARPIHPHWICDELRSTRCFTGKPVELGGTDYDREGIAGLGVAVAAREAVRLSGGTLGDIRCAIQGMGAMGAAVFRYLRSFGARIVAVSDPRLGGTFLLRETLPESLVEALSTGDFVNARSLLTAGAFSALPLDDVLFLEVDLIAPCALQDVLDGVQADRVQARYVVEGANRPLSREAQVSLGKRGVMVVPDFLANPGGIIAAYVELASTVTPEENVRTRAKVNEAKRVTEERIGANLASVFRLAHDDGLDLVDAGKLLAFRSMDAA